MRYRILGPLSVTEDGQGVSITAGRDRVVLAMLLLRAGRVVSVGALVDAVWEADPPATARGQLQTCVSRLRRALPAGAISSDPAGYRIDVGPGELDAVEFERLVAQAREQGDPALYRQALDLWRGDVLDGLDNHAVRQAAAVLDEQYAVVLEDWVELELAAGRERDLIGELGALVDRFPLRERLRGQLMRALHRSGRQADALAEYRRARDVLRTELGLDPGRELQELHNAMLGGHLAEADRPPAPVRCLPRTVGDFTGRSALVERLVGSIDAAGPAIAAIDGMAGSGKTTLALHVASLVGDRYPDAHLFVDLHGHSARAPLEPAAALLLLLRQLGLSAERVPADLTERINLWRNEVAGRRVLVIFDNAASSGQVADLLPTSAETLALVTSRRRLAGLDGVHPVSLPVFTEDEAVALLARIAGDRVAAEPGAAAELVRQCGALPLALRLAGARLAHRSRWQVADLVRRIGASVLPELAAENRTVADAFALSFGQLTDRAQRMFRLLGLYPGRSFDASVVAAIGDLSLGDAEDVLDDLEDVHLVEEPEPGVFRLHDLLREYAAALAAELDETDRHAAVVRALDFELQAALATVPASRRPRVAQDLGDPVPGRPDLVAALTEAAGRLERIRPSLGAMLDAGIAAGRPEYAWLLPRAAWQYLWSRGYTDDITDLSTAGREAAHRAGNDFAQAMSANYLASVAYLRGRYDEARILLNESIRLYEQTGDLPGLVTSLGNLAAVFNQTGQFVDAVEIAKRAIRLNLRLEGVSAQLRLDSLSASCAALGRYEEAIHYQRRRLQLVISEGDELGVVEAMLQLVMMRRQAGTIAPAVAERILRLVLRRMIRHQYLSGESDVRAELGDLLRVRRRYAEARTELRRSLAKSREIGDTRSQAMITNMLGLAVLAAGEPAEAAVTFRQALAVARAHAQPLEEARALLGLGDCAAGDPATAREHWQEAYRIFARLQVPQRFDAERRLTGRPGIPLTPLRLGARGQPQ